MTEQQLADLKMILREKDVPYFDDEQLEFYFRRNKRDFDKTVYECLILKSQDTTLQISGLNTADSSSFFRRLAAQYQPNNSGVLKP